MDRRESRFDGRGGLGGGGSGDPPPGNFKFVDAHRHILGQPRGGGGLQPPHPTTALDPPMMERMGD